MKKLNQSEKKVLTILEQNARMPASKIAKETRLSSEGVIKIINRLQERKIIYKFNTKINYSLMGQEIYPVHIKLNQINSEIIKKIKKIIQKHNSCAWHSFVEGEYDLMLSFKVKTKKDKEDMTKLLQELRDYILDKEVSLIIDSFEISKSFVKKQGKVFLTTNNLVEQIKLDSEELNLLNLLRKNSRQTVLELAKKLNSTARIVAGKIKKLEKSEIISGFKIKVNTALLGYQPCTALISLSSYTNEDLRKFITYCKYKEGIHYLIHQMGKYDINLTIDAININEFYQIVSEIRDEFPFIKKITTLISKF
jgi:Lrp/AsnC family transcriptional regulator, leucine-responsive regulatory protein